MKKYIVIATAFSLLSGIIIFSVFRQKKNIPENHQTHKRTLPPDIVQTSEEFKKHVYFRVEQAKKLIPCLKQEMPKEEVLDLLGPPTAEQELEYYSTLCYGVFYSDVLKVYFDKDNRLIYVDSPHVVFISHYERAWPLVRCGMSKSQAKSRFNVPSVLSDDESKWQYKDDRYVYTITFDDNNRIIDLEKSKRELTCESH